MSRPKGGAKGGLDRRALLSGGAAGAAMATTQSAAHAAAPPRRGGRDRGGGGGAPTLAPAVATTAGKVRGYVAGGVSCFRGIRFGASTAPPNRFKAPRRPVAWAGVRDCAIATGGPSAPQELRPPPEP